MKSNWVALLLLATSSLDDPACAQTVSKVGDSRVGYREAECSSGRAEALDDYRHEGITWTINLLARAAVFYPDHPQAGRWLDLAKHGYASSLCVEADLKDDTVIVGQKDPVRGWFALNAIVPSHDIIYRFRAELPRHFETVIQPMSVGTTSPMSVKTLEVTSADNKSCAALSCGDDTFLLSHDGPTQMTCGDIRFDGAALLLSRDPSARPVRLHMVGGRRLSLAGKDAFSTDSPTPTRTLELP